MPAATVPVVARSISGSPRAVISPTPIPAPVARRDEPSAAPIARELWRVQIGAFSQESRATAAWNGLKKSRAAILKGVDPHFIAGGSVVRLQLGGFSAPADASALCRALKESGQACFVVAAN
jgi:cell division septation protein DedD